jgi:hypothetical protein
MKLVMALSVVIVGATVAAWFFLNRAESEFVSLSATGQLIAYEKDRHDLTLQTEAGDRHFLVREGTPVHAGTRTLALADLMTAAHCRVKVRYGEPDGRPVARELRVSCDSIPPPAPH